MEIKKGDFIPTNWTGEPTEVMGFQHADLGHNIVDAIVFRSYDETKRLRNAFMML